MKLFVLGGTGGIGAAFIAQAVQRGHAVTALARAPERLLVHERVTGARGDPTEASAIAAALVGHDAVVSALGPRSRNDPPVLDASARAVVEAMETTGVDRLLVVSSALLFPGESLLRSILRRVLAKTLADSRAMDAVVEASATKWTIARPPRLTNGSGRGSYRAADGQLPAGGGSIARVDVARFLCDEVERGEHVRRIVGLSN